MNVGLAAPELMQRYAQMVVDDIVKYRDLEYDPNGDPYLNNDGTPYVCIEIDRVKRLARRWASAIQQSTSSGLPEVTLNLGGTDPGEDGSFNPATWTLSLSDDLFEKREHLSAVRCAGMATTMYHELRHAEQYYLMAYYVCVVNPNMSVLNVHYKVAGIKLDVILEAKEKARFPRKELYDFGKEMYQGELGSVEAKHKEVLKLCKERIGRIRDLCARQMANGELNRAMQYNEHLKEEIGDYNQTRPTGNLPKADDTALKEGWAFKVPELWQELKRASQHYSSVPNAYYQAYYKYLTAKRGFAADKWKKAYAAYATTATEYDAFAVEEQLKARLKGKGLDLDAEAAQSG